MHNNNDNDIDQAFTDLAWADMLHRLDEAMPQQRKRRPLGWWWLALGLVACSSGVLAWHWLGFRQSPPAQPKVVPVAPARPLAAEAPENCPPLLLPPSAEVASAPSPTPIAPAIKPAAAVTLVKLGAEPASVASSAVVLLPASQASQATVAPLPEHPTDPETTTPEALAALPAAPIQELLLPSADSLGAAEPRGRQPRRIATWIEGGLNGQYAPEGLHLGSGISYPLLGRLSVSVGLRYQFLRQGLSENSGSLLSSLFNRDSRLEASTTPGTQISVLDQVYTQNKVIRGHWLEVPLGLSYRLGSRWSLNAGAYAGYLLKAFTPPGLAVVSSQIVEDTSMHDSAINNSTGASWYGNATDQRAIEPSEIKRFQMGLWGSISFRTNPKWEFSLGIRQGSGSWLNTSPYQLNSQYWQAGVRYYIR